MTTANARQTGRPLDFERRVYQEPRTRAGAATGPAIPPRGDRGFFKEFAQGLGPDGVIRGEQAEAYGYVNRALPDAELDDYVDVLATRISGFDKWAIGQTRRLVNASLSPDVEISAGWDACIGSLGRPAAQHGIKTLMERGFHKPGDVEDRLGYHLGQLTR